MMALQLTISSATGVAVERVALVTVGKRLSIVVLMLSLPVAPRESIADAVQLRVSPGRALVFARLMLAPL